ncbi:flagellar basal body-associated FliL family protein [Ramlibacter sp.]|uniref:flagellar basal body-associated FliL family protein n=1 Tax=Ramlibacter sp. TaxID=1917967 RepID=UPI002C87C19E|nr:flagellar basal body-associated FliL family protein [Ramlibacter sp.]HWI83380.1 flagellar basal body-associated FliL family protein [Ramlibacter sp.]
MATTPETASPAPSRLKNKIIVAISLTLAMALGGGLYFLLQGAPALAAAAPKPVKPIFVTLEPLTVNLRSEGKAKFLHLGVALKLGDEQAQARVAEAMPELRSRLLLLLSNRDPAALTTPAEKSALAEEIRADLNRPLAAGGPAFGIGGVAFNAFVVQ